MAQNYILKEKIKMGISACNFGAMVRYNNVGWDRASLIGRQKFDYVWTPVCPEVNSGLGVPRDPMKLVNGNGDDFWAGNARMKNKKGRDVGDDVRKGSAASLEILKRVNIDAFVFMDGSPSCGVYRTTLKNNRLGKPPGVFGSLLLKEDLFLIPALDLESPWKWWDWSRRLHAFVWLKRKEIKTKKELYDIWHALKFICQEADVPCANAIGQRLAGAPKKIDGDFIAKWKSDVLQLIRRPSTLKRIQAVMVKHYAHYRKHFSRDGSGIQAPDASRSKQIFVEELGKMERKAAQEGYHFAGRPIVYKPG
ncbi:MAG TPA: DUF523 domain-containing protein, partial [Candidatus Omnitrophota bacterium]|nr:DUF523 domain-containing protein [Candidatus Omnitrophota bacterium]